MLHKPTLPELRALTSLQGSAQWRDFQTMLLSEIAAISKVLQDTPDTVTLYRMQGRAKALSELLEVIGDAKAILEKLDRRP